MLGFSPFSSSPFSALPDVALSASASQTLAPITNTATIKAVARATASQTLSPIVNITTSSFQASASQTLQPITNDAALQALVQGTHIATLEPITQVAHAQIAAFASARQTLPPITNVAQGNVFWHLPNCGWISLLGDSLDALMRQLPTGSAWLAFRWPGKTAFKLMTALSKIFDDAMAALCNLSRELDPRTTIEMLPEWEAAMSLPDPCLPKAVTIDERRRNLWFRLDKKRWRRVEDWKHLAAMFGLAIDVTPGWYVQRPALYDACFPKRYDLFPKLGRFRVYIDIRNVNFPGYEYGAGETPGYPIPYGFSDEAFDAFKCLINRVRPAHVAVIWNAFPTKYPCVLPFPEIPELDFSVPADSEYIPVIL